MSFGVVDKTLNNVLTVNFLAKKKLKIVGSQIEIEIFINLKKMLLIIQ